MLHYLYNRLNKLVKNILYMLFLVLVVFQPKLFQMVLHMVTLEELQVVLEVVVVELAVNLQQMVLVDLENIYLI